MGSFQSPRSSGPASAPPPPSVLELALLADDVYDAGSRGEVRGEVAVGRAVLRRSWRVAQHSGEGESVGFAAAMYRAEDGQRALAIRGTDPPSGDGWANLLKFVKDMAMNNAPLALGGLPLQFAFAKRMVQGFVGQGGTCITGHSLGGALATIIAAHEPVNAVSFNAPGAADSCVVSAVTAPEEFEEIHRRCIDHHRVRNIRTTGDLISVPVMLGIWGPMNNAHAGSPVETLPATGACGIFDARCEHSMTEVLRALGGGPEWLDPVRF